MVKEVTFDYSKTAGVISAEAVSYTHLDVYKRQGLIYMDPELFQIGLCLVPGQTGVFPEQLSRFLQYRLKCGNHKDRECVVLAYGVYQESLKENYGLDDILKFIVSDNDKRELAKEKEQHVSGSGYKDRYEYQADGELVPDKEYENRRNGEKRCV